MTTAIVSPSHAWAGIGFAIPVDEINQYVPEIIKHGKVARPGLGVQIASDQLTRQVGIESGVAIRSVVKDGPAAKAGIRSAWQDAEGVHVDVIVAIDDQPVHNAKDLYSIMEKHKIGDTIKVTVERDGERRDVSLTLTPIG